MSSIPTKSKLGELPPVLKDLPRFGFTRVIRQQGSSPTDEVVYNVGSLNDLARVIKQRHRMSKLK